MYALDADCLIRAKREYYPFERVPEYWEWLLHKAEEGEICIPKCIFNDLCKQDDDLKVWLKENENILVRDDSSGLVRLAEVMSAYEITDEEQLDMIGSDAYLIAFSLAESFTVVTKAVSATSKQGINRKIPDVCDDLGVSCVDDFEMLRVLDFKTNWKS